MKDGWLIADPKGSSDGWEIHDVYGVAATVHGEVLMLAHRQNAAAVESVPVMLDLLQRLALAEPGEVRNLAGEAEALVERIARGEFLPVGDQ